MFKSANCILIALFMLLLCILAKAAPYQELEPRKGHVPVYIRHGDESLSNIHPGLAEAFKEQPSAENLVAETTTESDIASLDVIKALDKLN
ncbi:hypothetical protein AWZ03_000100 [Drosophila navojoa]|uniref:Uncharacterized protein n=1 Tax=Drosophila navojoa TaxID=7232 RepID=A0A484C0T7_DRONA|nr:uncharacterized protein LOC108651170 [Drosophila navojoa]TDG53285.1 hypothetical protein AWZ03_000100 [Drosophila navojoa]